jgi:hypothetical protein
MPGDGFMRGECFCGSVCFELSGVIPNLYQCHCSLCRKVSGSSANAALVVGLEQLTWKRGEEQVTRYESESGFKSHFCSRCGSPLPNLTANDSAWWVPVGLLEDDAGLELGAHLFVGSRASWDVIGDAGEHFDEMPDAGALGSLLRRPGAPA